MIPEMDVGQSALLTDIAMCVNYYRLFSPGLYCCVHATVELDENVRLHPGILVMANHGRHKQCRPEPDYDLFRGGPNFVLDVFPKNDWLDYEFRRDAYERAKTIEYVAVRHDDPLTWIWNRLVDGKYQSVETKDDEFIFSAALPGMWIPTRALRDRDWWTVMGAVARGVSRKPHHEFMATIWNPS